MPPGQTRALAEAAQWWDVAEAVRAYLPHADEETLFRASAAASGMFAFAAKPERFFGRRGIAAAEEPFFIGMHIGESYGMPGVNEGPVRPEELAPPEPDRMRQLWASLEAQAVKTELPRDAFPLVLRTRQAEMFVDLLLPARIRLRKNKIGGATFELHHDNAAPVEKSWAWVFAVRDGLGPMLLRRHEAAMLNAALPLEERLARRDALSEHLHRIENDPDCAATMASLGGPDIVDLVAVSRDLTRVLGRLKCTATVLGYPQRPDDAEKPVRLFRDVPGWLAARCAGVVLVGTPDENLDWLRWCAAGIVTDDLAHGKAVKKMLHRPFVGPDVLVAG